MLKGQMIKGRVSCPPAHIHQRCLAFDAPNLLIFVRGSIRIILPGPHIFSHFIPRSLEHDTSITCSNLPASPVRRVGGGGGPAPWPQYAPPSPSMLPPASGSFCFFRTDLTACKLSPLPGMLFSLLSPPLVHSPQGGQKRLKQGPDGITNQFKALPHPHLS